MRHAVDTLERGVEHVLMLLVRLAQYVSRTMAAVAISMSRFLDRRWKEMVRGMAGPDGRRLKWFYVGLLVVILAMLVSKPLLGG